MKNILVINPGSTSTKIAIYENEKSLFVENIEHDTNDLKQYKKIIKQYDFRKNYIVKTLEKHNFHLNKLSAIAARGGILPPMEAGAYLINKEMLKYLKENSPIDHASNLGAIIAASIAEQLNIKAYIYDPVTVDEMIPLTRITGRPEIKRRGVGHNLNMRAAAIKNAKIKNENYYKNTYIVAHLGGGITLSLHHNGKIIDMISDGEGPFSPERAGGLPIWELLDFFIKNDCNLERTTKLLRSESGFIAYFNTTDTRTIIEEAKTNENTKLILEAFVLNIAKNIAKLSVVNNGKINQIILTGGLAKSEYLCSLIEERVKFIAKIAVLPGENELEALALGILRVLNQEEVAKTFSYFFD